MLTTDIQTCTRVGVEGVLYYTVHIRGEGGKHRSDGVRRNDYFSTLTQKSENVNFRCIDTHVLRLRSNINRTAT